MGILNALQDLLRKMGGTPESGDNTDETLRKIADAYEPSSGGTEPIIVWWALGDFDTAESMYGSGEDTAPFTVADAKAAVAEGKPIIIQDPANSENLYFCTGFASNYGNMYWANPNPDVTSGAYSYGNDESQFYINSGII